GQLAQRGPREDSDECQRGRDGERTPGEGAGGGTPPAGGPQGGADAIPQGGRGPVIERRLGEGAAQGLEILDRGGAGGGGRAGVVGGPGVGQGPAAGPPGVGAGGGVFTVVGGVSCVSGRARARA